MEVGLTERAHIVRPRPSQPAVRPRPSVVRQQQREAPSGVCGASPPRIASLAYDAVSLAAGLARSGDFSSAAITNSAGFQGQNGLFRFRSNGLIERGLSILQMTPNGPEVVAQSPNRFGAGF